MVMKTTDKIMAPPRGSHAQAVNFFTARSDTLRRDEVLRYLATVFELAPEAGIDPSIVVAQASHETGYFTSYWWNARLNPAGLGVTGDPKQNAASKFFKDGEDAARGQMAHLMLYATGYVTAPFTPEDTPRYDAYVSTYGHTKKAETINGLTNTWGMDSGYATKVVRHGNEIFPDLSSTPVVRGPVIMAPWEGYSTALVGGVRYEPKRSTVTVNVSALNTREDTTTNARVLRTLPLNTSIRVFGWSRGQNVSGEDRWWISDTYERIWVGGTQEKP